MSQMGRRGPEPEVSDEELISAIRGTPYPVAATKDVSEQVSISSTAVRKRLNKLAERDRIGRRKLGGNAVVYWLPED